MREAALSPLTAKAISSDTPTETVSRAGKCASFGKSYERDEVSATSENDPGTKPKEHIKLGWSQSIFSNANLARVHPGCKPLRCAARVGEPGAARLAHQTPKVKRKMMLQPVNFFNTRFTKVIVTLCSLKVNPLLL